MTHPTLLVKTQDGVLFEVDAVPGSAVAIAGGSIEILSAKLDSVGDIVQTVSEKIASAIQKLEEQYRIPEIEIELGVAFGAEGNLFVTKSTLNANLKIKIKVQRTV